jgi:hypothetical protein
LRGRLLIAGRAVDLARQEQALQALRLQRRGELARIDVIVFDRVAGPDDRRLFQPGIVATSAR